jgi:hypothetical protein
MMDPGLRSKLEQNNPFKFSIKNWVFVQVPAQKLHSRVCGNNGLFDPTSSTTLDGAGLIAGIDVVSRDGSGVEQDADSTVTNLNDDR